MNELLDAEFETLEQDLASVATPDTNDHVPGEYAPSMHHNADSSTMHDDASEEQNEYALNVDVTSTLEKRHHDVMSALQKIDDGDYGVCESCGQDIPEDRLRANPSALLCMACA